MKPATCQWRGCDEPASPFSSSSYCATHETVSRITIGGELTRPESKHLDNACKGCGFHVCTCKRGNTLGAVREALGRAQDKARELRGAAQQIAADAFSAAQQPAYYAPPERWTTPTATDVPMFVCHIGERRGQVLCHGAILLRAGERGDIFMSPMQPCELLGFAIECRDPRIRILCIQAACDVVVGSPTSVGSNDAAPSLAMLDTCELHTTRRADAARQLSVGHQVGISLFNPLPDEVQVRALMRARATR